MELKITRRWKATTMRWQHLMNCVTYFRDWRYKLYSFSCTPVIMYYSHYGTFPNQLTSVFHTREKQLPLVRLIYYRTLSSIIQLNKICDKIKLYRNGYPPTEATTNWHAHYVVSGRVAWDNQKQDGSNSRRGRNEH